MISHIKVKNFKSLKQISVPLANLNLLTGLNGMGKSSLIQVLLLLKQSDKLDFGILSLNGDLTRIGQGRDALYQFSDEELIVFEVVVAGEYRFSWDFNYQKEKEKLISNTSYSGGGMHLFNQYTKLFQYIPAERIGPRDIYDAHSVVVTDKRHIGLLGEYAAYYINVFGHDLEVSRNLRHPKANSNNLLSQINAWMNEISPGVSLNTKYVPEVNKVILDYQFDLINDKTNTFRPVNVGFGISYVLPVVLALLTSEPGKIIIIENPESHIHPRGQAELGKLISLAAQCGAQLFIETHSDHILNGIRVAVRNNSIDKEKVNILYFDKETTEKEQFTVITKIKVDKNGELNEYPKNFLDEWTNQLLNLI